MRTEKKKKQQAYKKYIKEHIKNVNIAWKGLRIYIDCLTAEDYYDIDSLITKHDKSKYSKEEFEGYRQFFFPCDNDIKNKDSFINAWNHHQKTNPHHWQYWLMYEGEKTKALEMPFKYIIEMLCDWLAMSIKFNNKPSDWYRDNRDKIFLNDTTQIITERFIPILDIVYKKNKEV